jgi:hypothetical protein
VEPVQAFVTVKEHNGNDVGGVTSLNVEFAEVDDRVSAKKVLKHGMLSPKIALRSTEPSRNSPVRYVVDELLSVKGHPPGLTVTADRTGFPLLLRTCVKALFTEPQSELLSNWMSQGAGDLV